MYWTFTVQENVSRLSSMVHRTITHQRIHMTACAIVSYCRRASECCASKTTTWSAISREYCWRSKAAFLLDRDSSHHPGASAPPLLGQEGNFHHPAHSRQAPGAGAELISMPALTLSTSNLNNLFEARH